MERAKVNEEAIKLYKLLRQRIIYDMQGLEHLDDLLDMLKVDVDRIEDYPDNPDAYPDIYCYRGMVEFIITYGRLRDDACDGLLEAIENLIDSSKKSQ